MKIALIGYGKMGQTIEKIAIERGHSIVCKIDINQTDTFDSPQFTEADVAIEFTAPTVAYGNYLKCFERNKPVVSGTTGWLEHLDDIRSRCADGSQTFFYASNYSLGVNIFFELNRRLAQIMNRFGEYGVEIEETHHIHKLDAPSGTAISLAQGICDNMDRKNGWTLAPEERADAVRITAFREGEVPGIHTIRYESADALISITHSAKSRRALAYGAVLAAEFTMGRKGFLQMKDMLSF